MTNGEMPPKGAMGGRFALLLTLWWTAGRCIPDSERIALLGFFNATNGHGWFTQTGWFTYLDHCQWYGVQCDAANAHIT